jgi:hypothetical protein
MDVAVERTFGFGTGWRIVQLRLTPEGASPPTVPGQYCHMRGDVQPAH